MYVPVNPLAQFARDGTEHLFEHFLDVKTIDFVSNRAFVLPRTAEAWHGVPTVQASQGQRKMILIAGMDKNLMDKNQ